MVVKHAKKNRKKMGYNMRQGLRRRGSGNRGGVGAAGHGKRCKQKKHQFMKDGQIDYGKHGFHSKSQPVEGISIGLLCEKAVKSAEKKGSKYLINAKGMKVLGSGTVNIPIILSNYCGVTKKAEEKIVKAGGEVVAK
ncbi:MAG: uL15 family ribosomal protein [Nanoarchaeota archaeon]|nr:uL15 family ribosomal protein [Nanoarchaeota archaeon]